VKIWAALLVLGGCAAPRLETNVSGERVAPEKAKALVERLAVDGFVKPGMAAPPGLGPRRFLVLRVLSGGAQLSLVDGDAGTDEALVEILPPPELAALYQGSAPPPTSAQKLARDGHESRLAKFWTSVRTVVPSP
jgi:hypothetical protein